MLLGIIKTLRPRQWVKNLFVLAPLVFAHDLFDGKVLWRALLAFAAFSMLAGAVYTINDLVDVEDDRQHPTKRNRPIAAGKVSPGMAKVTAVVLIVVALAGSLRLDWSVFATALAYLLLQIAYSLRLKQFAYLDVVCIAAGFVLRVVAGSFAVSTWIHPVRPSLYLLACTAFLALFLGFGKRYHELRVNAAKARNALKTYNLAILQGTLWATSLCTVAVYLAWTLDPPDFLNHARGYLWATTAFVPAAMGRFSYLLSSDSGDSPTDSMLRDVPFVVTVLVWSAVIITIIYRLHPANS